ncbi:MAG: glycosyl transferase [Candidatus Moraniibacteriota bacterium]|nr:MAG: glycosyl transferase [Candidatus Moranbacteria bacterium]
MTNTPHIPHIANDNTSKIGDLTILLIAISITVITRLALILLIDVQPSSDMGWYYHRAIELLETGRYQENGIPTAFWPVGYPAFLALVMAIGGASVLTGQLANLSLSVACTLLTYHLCIRQFNSQRIAAIATSLMAVYPNQMGYSLGLYSEPLYTTLLLLIWILFRPNCGLLTIICAGLIGGLATLVKTQMLLLAPPLFFLLSLNSWERQNIISALRKSFLASAVMLLTIAPWTIRNHQVMGSFIPVSTNGGLSLLAGNNPSMTSDLRTDFNDNDPIFEEIKFSASDQVAADKRARSAALTWIGDNPSRFIFLMPKKLIRLWIPDGESEWNIQRGFANYEKWRFEFRTARVLNQAYYFLLLTSALYAFLRCIRLSNPQTLAIPFALIYFTVLSLVFSGQSRYHAPLMPLIISYAAWTVTRLLTGYSKTPASRRQ